jgi:hypothetical protein
MNRTVLFCIALGASAIIAVAVMPKKASPPQTFKPSAVLTTSNPPSPATPADLAAPTIKIVGNWVSLRDTADKLRSLETQASDNYSAAYEEYAQNRDAKLRASKRFDEEVERACLSTGDPGLDFGRAYEVQAQSNALALRDELLSENLSRKEKSWNAAREQHNEAIARVFDCQDLLRREVESMLRRQREDEVSAKVHSEVALLIIKAMVATKPADAILAELVKAYEAADADVAAALHQNSMIQASQNEVSEYATRTFHHMKKVRELMKEPYSNDRKGAFEAVRVEGRELAVAEERYVELSDALQKARNLLEVASEARSRAFIEIALHLSRELS